MSILWLDHIDFINDADDRWQLIDGTFEAPPPEPVDIRSGGPRGALVSRHWKNRKVSFEYQVNDVPASNGSIDDNITAVARVIYTASSKPYLEGDYFGNQIALGSARDTGDRGVILSVRLGPEGTDTFMDESGATVDNDRILTTRVISGTQEIIGPYSTTSQFDEGSGENKVLRVRVTLECEPFFLGQSRIIDTIIAPGLCDIPIVESDYTSNKIIIAGSKIEGDLPALTRITTSISNGLGLVMGRHAGVALVNCPSRPIFTGSGLDDMMALGFDKTESEIILRVKIVATGGGGDTIQYSLNDGSSWSGNIVITNHAPIVIAGTTKISVMFFSSTGHTTADEWRFKNNQTYLVTNSSVLEIGLGEVDSVSGQYTSESGTLVNTFDINIPHEATGKWKIMAQMETTQAWQPEYRMKVYYQSFRTGAWRDAAPTSYDWVRGFESNLLNIIDLGTLDLTPSASPIRGQEGAASIVKIEIYARGQRIESESCSLAQTRTGIFPAQDNEGFLWVGWAWDRGGREVFCNYDYRNPYIGEISADRLDQSAGSLYDVPGDVELDNILASDLDESHVGNILTLFPGVDNTIVMSPILTLSGSNVDFRSYYWSAIAAAFTGAITIAIRPRYLFVGGGM